MSRGSGVWADLRSLIAAAWRIDPRGVTSQVIFLVVTGLTGGVSLLLLLPIVSAVADPSGVVTLPVVGAVAVGRVPLPVLLGSFVVLVAVQSLLRRSATVNAISVQQRVTDAMRQRAFDAILVARWSWILQRRRSDVIEIVTAGATRTGIAVQQLLSAAVTAALSVATAVVALVVSPLVAGISIIAVALMGALLATSFVPSHRLGREFGRENRRLQSIMIDSMDSLRLARAHDAAATWSGQLSDAFASTRVIQLENTRRNASVAMLSSIGLAVAASLLVLVAVWSDLPGPAIAVILVLVARLATYVQTLAQSIALLVNALPAVNDLIGLGRDALEHRETPAGEVAPRDLSYSPLLELRDVSFTYPQSSSGVVDVSLTVPTRGITAITGPSGAGKSTSVDIVLGLLSPDSGEVLVAGVPLREQELPWWRSHVAYVPQETVLIAGTLRQNLVWSVNREVTDDECWDMLDRCACAFARDLPDGLDTLLGDNGLRLSGGERQRVAIARALLRRPALLVMDEATSALDDATEASVIDLLNSLAASVTVLVIAHRRTTVESAAHVVRIDAGRTLGDAPAATVS